MSEASELRQMSNEQLDATEKEAAKTLFKLRSQSQTDRLEAPTEIRRNRRLIARVKTIRRERELAETRKRG
jgi:large subunit ribosomal protein L29